MGKIMDEFCGRNAFKEFMQIVYEQLSLKADSSVVEEIKVKIEQLGESANLLTVDDIVASFEDFDPTAEDAGRKVAAATLVKQIRDELTTLQGQFEAGVDADTLGGLGKDDFVKTTNVITSWDEYDAETLQVVAATLIKAIDTKIDTFIDSKGKPNGIAPLDSNGMIPSEHLPGYVDDVVDVYVVTTETEEGEVVTVYTDAEHTTELVPETGKIYVDVTNPNVAGDTYRWSGTAFVNMGHPKFKEITAEEVQTMWDSIVIPDDTETEEEPSA